MGKINEQKDKVLRMAEKLKAEKEKLKTYEVAEKKKQTRAQNKKDILYGIYRRMLHAEEYENDLKEGSSFDKFLTRDYERAYFGFAPIQDKVIKGTPELNTEAAPTEPVKVMPVEPMPNAEASPAEESETPKPDYHFEPRPEGGVYLDVDFKYREIAKPFGAIFDKPAKKWYAPDGIDPEPIQRAVNEARNKAVEK